MTHHHYDTEALVVWGSAEGEANRSLLLFTKELGLVRGLARGVRRERSKLRYSLRELSHTRVSLVRGREVWRVTGAVIMADFHQALLGQPRSQKLAARLCLLLRRLLPGEEKNEVLFNVVIQALAYLSEKKPHGEVLSAVEHLTVLRMLAALGYRSSDPSFAGVLSSADIGEPSLTLMSGYRHQSIAEINALLHETHL